MEGALVGGGLGGMYWLLGRPEGRPVVEDPEPGYPEPLGLLEPEYPEPPGRPDPPGRPEPGRPEPLPPGRPVLDGKTDGEMEENGGGNAEGGIVSGNGEGNAVGNGEGKGLKEDEGKPAVGVNVGRVGDTGKGEEEKGGYEVAYVGGITTPLCLLMMR